MKIHFFKAQLGSTVHHVPQPIQFEREIIATNVESEIDALTKSVCATEITRARAEVYAEDLKYNIKDIIGDLVEEDEKGEEDKEKAKEEKARLKAEEKAKKEEEANKANTANGVKPGRPNLTDANNSN